MDDHVEMTDEELDRLIADFSGDCEVGEGDDFDVVSELDELNNISEFPAFDPKKGVAAEVKGDTIVSVKAKPGEIAIKGADVIKKAEEKTTATAKETVTEHAEMKKVECVKQMEGEKILKGAEGKGEPTTEDKKKDKENVKESITVAAEISVDIDKKKLTKEVKCPVAKEGNVASAKKKPEEKGNSGAAKSADSPGKAKKILDGQSQKSAGDGQNVKAGDGIKPTKETLDRTEKKGLIMQSADENPSSKGTKRTQSKADGAKSGKENLKLSAGSSPDAGELVTVKGEVTMSPPSATSVTGDAGSTSEEKTGDETIGETKNVHAETSADNISKSNKGKKKGGWGWGGISSWGSSVISQVGGSLYHVLETVESSLVEPESEDSSKSSLNQDQEGASKDTEKSGEGETADDVVLFQPSSAVEITESKASRSVDESSRAPVDSSTAETKNRIKAPPSTGFDDDKIEDLGAEAGAEETLDQKKKSGKKRKAKSKESDPQEQSWFSGWDLSTITGAVQQTGKKVVSTGIDVLENIGRKTMNILADEPEDGVLPLSPSSSLSSQPLSSRRKKKLDSKTSEDPKTQMLRKCFDDCQGLAHFDALVDLSKTSQEKLAKQLERISHDQLEAIKSDLALIKDASDLGGMDWEESFGSSDHDFCQLIKDFISQLSLSTNVQKLFNVQETMSKWLTSCIQENSHTKKFSAEDIHKMAIMMFADFTATGIAVFHKIAQLLLVDYSTPILSYKFRALSLAGLTKVLCTEIWIEARRFTECLNVPELVESPDGTLSLITNVTLEASNCSSCLQDGYRLMLPIVQLAALKVHPLVSSSSEIANMELLQLMSSMSQNKVSKILGQLSPDARQSVKTQLSTIEAAFDLSDLGHENDGDKSDCDFGPRVLECLQQIGVTISSQKLLQAQEQTHDWLLSCETDRENSKAMSPSDVNQMALKSLNDLTLCSIDIFRVIGQGLLMENSREISAYGMLASAIKELTKVLCLEVGCQSTKFTNCILKISNLREELLGKNPEARGSSAESVSPFVTNIYLEASNSTTHIQDGFQLLLPIIQLALFKAHPACAGFNG